MTFHMAYSLNYGQEPRERVPHSTARYLSLLMYPHGSTDALTYHGFQYLVPWARVGPAREDSQTPEIGKELWTWMEEQVEHV